jgi:hypothetical protein
MRMSGFVAKIAAVLLLTIPLAATSVAGSAEASVAAGRAGLSIAAQLTGVATVSASNVWVVGYTGGPASPKILIEHWDGSTWKQELVPGVVNGVLNAVTAASASSLWAVGSTDNFESGDTLVLHWNGTTWAKVPSPSPAAKYGDDLFGVTAPSADSAWAVGVTNGSPSSYPLVLRWNGKAWAQVSSPALKDTDLVSVAVATTSSAWAVGEDEATMSVPVLEHWNGTAWAVAKSPIDGVFDYLTSVAAASPTSVWAVGFDGGSTLESLSMHWNGTVWKQVPIPHPSSETLEAVATAPGGTAWAVGATSSGQGGSTPLILHWNGTAWAPAATPAATGTLYSVSATSSDNAWAAGYTLSDKTLVFDWNGKSWT